MNKGHMTTISFLAIAIIVFVPLGSAETLHNTSSTGEIYKAEITSNDYGIAGSTTLNGEVYATAGQKLLKETDSGFTEVKDLPYTHAFVMSAGDYLLVSHRRDNSGTRGYTVFEDTENGLTEISSKELTSEAMTGQPGINQSGYVAFTRHDNSGGTVWVNTPTGNNVEQYTFNTRSKTVELFGDKLFVGLQNGGDPEWVIKDISEGTQKRDNFGGSRPSDVTKINGNYFFLFQGNSIYKTKGTDLSTWTEISGTIRTPENRHKYSQMFNYNGKIAVGGKNGVIKLLNTDGEVLVEFDVGSNPITGFGIKDGQLIANEYDVKTTFSVNPVQPTNTVEEPVFDPEQYYNQEFAKDVLTTSATVFTGTTLSYAVFGDVIDNVLDFSNSDLTSYLNDVRANAIILEEDRKNFLAGEKNTLKTIYGQAQAEAKQTAIEDLNSGKSLNTAMGNAETEVNKLYSDVIRNTVENYNSEVYNLKKASDTAQELGGKISEVIPDRSGELEFTNATIELPNGKEVQSYNVFIGGKLVASLKTSNQIITTDGANGIESANLINGKVYKDFITQIKNDHEEVQGNANTIVNEIYENYQKSEINSTEALGPLEAFATASTEYNTTGSDDYLVYALSQMGIPTNQEASFEISYNGETYDGFLFLGDQFSETISEGQTIDGSQGMSYLVRQGSDSKAINLDGEFTVESITDVREGEQMTETTLKEREIYTVNTTKLASQLQEEEEATSGFTLEIPGGGISGSLGSMFGEIPVIGIVLAVIGLLYLA